LFNLSTAGIVFTLTAAFTDVVELFDFFERTGSTDFVAKK